jgi:hypothetical protein
VYAHTSRKCTVKERSEFVPRLNHAEDGLPGRDHPSASTPTRTPPPQICSFEVGGFVSSDLLVQGWRVCSWGVSISDSPMVQTREIFTGESPSPRRASGGIGGKQVHRELQGERRADEAHILWRFNLDRHTSLSRAHARLQTRTSAGGHHEGQDFLGVQIG